MILKANVINLIHSVHLPSGVTLVGVTIEPLKDEELVRRYVLLVKVITSLSVYRWQ